ncbi:MAG TPA: MmgE/PrpD family protein [Pseudonocardiaceae bacterium]|nr:MmgE/PrpD family protein [Pseudonocardiaceae bacterium]
MTDTEPRTTTRVLADYVADLTVDALPHELVRKVARQCLDVVGVAMAGIDEPAAAAVRRLAGPAADGDRATIWGVGTTATRADAAFANATAAHALDYDDMWLPGAHPSAPIFPAALAVAEQLGSSGAELVTAQAAGYEVMGRLHSSVSGRFGWHPTGVFGTFGAVAACGRLLGLSGDRMAEAFGIASSMTGGIDGHSGTMTKPLHAGLAAHAGVRAALLAADGFTASPAVFDGKRSFFEAFFATTTPQAWRLTADLGRTFYPLSPGIGIKMYPAGYYMHQTFEAALGIVADHSLSTEDIKSIRIGLTGSRFDRPFPRTSLDAKFSLQYMAAMAVLYRRLTVDLFDESVVHSDPVRSVLSRIEGYVDPHLPANPDIAHNPVTVECVDGRRFAASVTMPRSHWRYPLPRADWLAKFRANTTCLDPDIVTELIDTFDHLAQLPDVRTITALLAQRSTA